MRVIVTNDVYFLGLRTTLRIRQSGFQFCLTGHRTVIDGSGTFIEITVLFHDVRRLSQVI